MKLAKGVMAAALGLCVTGVTMAQQTPPGKAAAEDANPANRAREAGQVQPGQRQPGVQVQPGQRVQAQPQNVQRTGEQAAGNAQWQNKEQTIAQCVAIDNQGEIALSKFAKDKLHSDEAKEFADMMVKDHSAFLAKLDRFAPNASTDNGFLNSTDREEKSTTQRDRNNQDRNVAANPNAATPVQRTTGFRGDAAGLDFMQVHREIAQQCLASSKEMLNDKKDHEVDQCFIGMQIAKHAAMKDKLTVLERHASGDLAQVLSEGRETAEKHMKHAIDVMEKLDKHADKEDRSARREERQNRNNADKKNE